jgi:hypothetical protein
MQRMGETRGRSEIRLVAQSIVHFVQIANALIEAHYYPKVGLWEAIRVAV